MRFENMRVWQKGKDLAVEVYKETNDMKDFGFKDQITRSALSIPSNIAEGMERETDKELRRYLIIARGSCAELKTQTIIAREIGYLIQSRANNWINECNQIGRMLGAFIKKLPRSSQQLAASNQ